MDHPGSPRMILEIPGRSLDDPSPANIVLDADGNEKYGIKL